MSSNSTQEDRMYEAQARIISSLREQIKKLDEKVIQQQKQLSTYKMSGIYYNTMQKAIMDNETLQDEWNRFVSMLKLCVPDLEKQMKDAAGEAI